MLKIDKKVENQNPSIMEPMESLTFVKEEALRPDLVSGTDFKSIPFINTVSENQYDSSDYSNRRSFLLMDEQENLQVATPELFCKRLRSSDNDKIKVVSIFGNTGDGKSHTMNHTFFCGEEVFKTSSEQNSCTIGVYAAMQNQLGVLCLDTEGLLGTTAKSNRRMRMLLKILAISDIVIYRTRSERLHSDMFDFLGTASKAFCSHFAQALQSLAIPGTAQALGPAVIVFHETRHTKPLDSSVEESAEDKLRQGFARLNIETNAFSSLRYVGIKTPNDHSTDFSKIIAAIQMEIENTAVRSPRQPSVVYKAMKALNLKFSGEIVEKAINPFPEQYFTCTVHCESCSRRCQRSMGHVVDGENHQNTAPCNYQHQFENKVLLCQQCYKNGREVIVTIGAQSQNENSLFGYAKYAWKGSIIECPNCGEIYRERQYWYGNKPPEATAVRSEIVHVWKGGNVPIRGPVHSAQMVLDGVSYLAEAISSLGSKPTKALSDLLADTVAPSYWKPNSEITHCHECRKNFEKTGLRKHHCRGCGEGFCNACSRHKLPVPGRGWNEPVRVCSDCRQELLKNQNAVRENPRDHLCYTTTNNTGPPNEEGDIFVRKYSETIYNTLSSVTSVLEYPKEIIKDTARPTYWVPDSESPSCSICKVQFGTAEELLKNAMIPTKNDSSSGRHTKEIGDCWRHHCRACGQAVCGNCSATRRPVPERGWTSDVRVCDACSCEGKSKFD